MGHRAHVEHHSEGRIRIRVPSAKGDADALDEIKRALSSVAGVESVTVNETIGTVTLNYDQARDVEIKRHLIAEAPGKKVVVCKEPTFDQLHHMDQLIEKEAEFLADHSHIARVLFDFVEQMDQGIKRATNNSVDLKVIAPLALAAGVFFELGVAASTPVWLTLGLFSFNHFIDLHSHPQTNRTKTSGQDASAGTGTVDNSQPPARRAQRFP